MALNFKSEVGTIEHKVLAFLDFKHVVLIFALVAALLGGFYFFEDRQVKIAEGRQAVAEARAQQSAEDAKKSEAANAQLQAQKDLVIQQLQAANASYAEANKKLVDAMSAETAALEKQKTVDRTSTPTEQSARWQQLVPTAVVKPTDNGFEVNAQGGLDTLFALEEVPVDRQKISQLTTALANDESTIKNDANILQAEKDKHQGDLDNDRKQLTASQDQTKQVQAEFDTYKHKARKRIVKAFVIGYVAGLVTHKFLGL